MIFGTVFSGQVKTQEGQCIETKFFCFILPLYVLETILVTESAYKQRKGLIIKNNTTSIIASIIRPIITIILFFAIGAYLGNDNVSWLLLPILLAILLFIYCWFYFGRTTDSEYFVRRNFAKNLGLYIMPEWLRPYDLKVHFEKLKKNYITTYGVPDWKEKIKQISIYDDEFSLVFCVTALENTIDKNEEIKKLLDEIIKQGL